MPLRVVVDAQNQVWFRPCWSMGYGWAAPHNVVVGWPTTPSEVTAMRVSVL